MAAAFRNVFDFFVSLHASKVQSNFAVSGYSSEYQCCIGPSFVYPVPPPEAPARTSCVVATASTAA